MTSFYDISAGQRLWSRVQYTGPLDSTVHHELRKSKRKRKRKRGTPTRFLGPFGLSLFLLKLKIETENTEQNIF